MLAANFVLTEYKLTKNNPSLPQQILWGRYIVKNISKRQFWCYSTVCAHFSILLLTLQGIIHLVGTQILPKN